MPITHPKSGIFSVHHFTGMDFQQTKLIPRAFTKLKLRLGLKSPVVIKDLCNIQRFPARGAAAQSAGSLAVFGSSLALPGWRWGRRGARGGQGDGRPAAVLAHSRAAEGRLGPRTRRRPPPAALGARCARPRLTIALLGRQPEPRVPGTCPRHPSRRPRCWRKEWSRSKSQAGLS